MVTTRHQSTVEPKKREEKQKVKVRLAEEIKKQITKPRTPVPMS